MLYTHFLSLLLNEIILKVQGNKFITKGYINEIDKHIMVFLIRHIWLFLNTAQNEDK